MRAKPPGDGSTRKATRWAGQAQAAATAQPPSMACSYPARARACCR
nr:MAG: MC144R [Molluscum contagiosum virus]